MLLHEYMRKAKTERVRKSEFLDTIDAKFGLNNYVGDNTKIISYRLGMVKCTG